MYGLFVWGNRKFSNKNRLVTLQKKVLRIVNGSSYLTHTEPIFKNLKILKLYDLYILYGLFVWGNSKFSNKNRLVTLQKKAIRIVNGSRYLTHTEPIFKNLKILKLSDLYIMQGIKHFCSITGGNSPNYISNNVKVSSEIHKYHTRQSQNIFKESIQTKIQEQSLNFKLDHSWNMLPHMTKELVKNIPNLNF